ncbi:hypothetical protein M3Y94_00326300 [Aphelenchoides besseyi]|nr:hypothetical protein M3Y94_00326300 [Aphelenchoides besseyi]
MEQADPANNIYLVEKLLNRRWKKNRAEYLVKWVGYPPEENTWEPRFNINPLLVEQYDAEHGGPLSTPTPRGSKRKVAQPASSSSASSTPQRTRTRAPPKPREENPPNRSRRRQQNDTANSEQNVTTESNNSESIAAEEDDEPQAKKTRSNAVKESIPKNVDNGTTADEKKATKETKIDESKSSAKEPQEPAQGTSSTVVEQKPDDLPADSGNEVIITKEVETTKETSIVPDESGNPTVVTTTTIETIEEELRMVEPQEQFLDSVQNEAIVEEPQMILDEPMESILNEEPSASAGSVEPMSVPQIMEIKETSATVVYSNDEQGIEERTSVVENHQTIQLIEPPSARPEDSSFVSLQTSTNSNRSTVTEVTASGRTIEVIELS